MTDDLTPEEQEFLDTWKAKQRCRRRRILLIACAVVLALALLPVIGALIYGWYWQARLDSRIAELQAQGKMLNYQQVLDRDKDLPAEQNSALVYLKAFDQLQETPQTQVVPWLHGDFGARPSPTAMRLLASVAESDAQALATIQSAAALPDGCYPLAADRESWNFLLEHCEKVRNTVRLCGQLAAFQAADGRPAQAAECIMGCLGLSSSFGRKAFTLENLVRISADFISVAGLEHSLSLCQFSAADLAMLRARLALEETGRSSAWGLAVDRSQVHHELASGDSPGVDLLGPLLRIIPGRRQRADFAYLTAAQEAERLNTLPPRRALAEMASHEASMATYPGLDMPIWSPYSRALKSEVADEMQLAVTSAALAVEQYRLENGRWPNSLDQLVPEFMEEVPEDYFSTGKIRYVRTDEGVTLYSVGQDGGDDGGVSLADTSQSALATYDLPFRLLNPDLRGGKTMAFRDEILRTAIDLKDLAAAGFDEEKLKALGLTEDDLRTLR